MLNVLTAESTVEIGDWILAGRIFVGTIVGPSSFWTDRKGHRNQSVNIEYQLKSGSYTTDICFCPENNGNFKLLPRNKKKRNEYLTLIMLENY